MKYISKMPNPNGAYPPIFEGDLNPLPEDLVIWPENLSTDGFYKYNGFVHLRFNGTRVSGYSVDTRKWEEWKASLPPEEPKPEPSLSALDIDMLAEAYKEGVESA